MADKALSSVLSEANSDGGDNAETGRSGKCQRFAPSSTKLLQRWFSSHHHHPYPTEEEKAVLHEQTGLSIRQISTWFANTRRRNSSQSARSSSTLSALGSISVPDLSIWSNANPLDRWRNSPPDQEGASLNAIAQAVANTGNIQHSSSYDGIGTPQLLALHARSEASNDSRNSSSGDSSSSANSFAGFRQNSPHRHRRRRRFVKPQSVRPQEVINARIFQCTFCTDSFKSKFDWTRHEATLHLILEKWTCAPFGPKHHKQGEEAERCVFCDEMYPTDAHLSSHEYEVCRSKPISARTFYRKDHLRQHLRVIHKVNDFQSSMLRWNIKLAQINCRCGFCGERFTSWPERNEHIADHFREGAVMKDWKGCRGLDPAVALKVQNAMPPYLIGTESNEFEPFSASRAASKEPYLDYPEQNEPTMFENLTGRLTEYVTFALQGGTLITDETVRKQARLILFGDDDAWNQTPADNAEWLRLFKNGLGLGRTPTSTCTNKQKILELGPVTGDSGQNSLQRMTIRFPNSSLLSSETTYQDFLRQGCEASPIGITVHEFQSLPLAWQTPECLAEFRQMQEDSLPSIIALPMSSCAANSACPQGMVSGGRSEQDLVANFPDKDLNAFMDTGYPQIAENNYDIYSSVDDLVFPFDLNFDESET